MSKHPALQPRMGLATVTQLLADLDAEARAHHNLAEHATHGPARLEHEGIAKGLERAHRMLTDFWSAESAITAAVSQWLDPTTDTQEPSHG